MNTTIIFYNIIAATLTVTVHGFMKALISSSLGDPLPKRDKRVTLNPLKHIEPIGFIIMVALGFGWGKPVETASIYYKDRKTGTILTYTLPSVACLLFGVIVYTVMMIASVPIEVQLLMTMIALFNIRHAFFNIIPIYPLDGSKVLSAMQSPNQAIRMVNNQMFLQLLLVMAVLWGFVGRVIDPISWSIFAFIGRIFMPGSMLW